MSEVKKIVIEYTAKEFNGVCWAVKRSRPLVPDLMSFTPKGSDKKVTYGKCAKCKGTVFKDQKYCPECGQAILWTDKL